MLTALTYSTIAHQENTDQIQARLKGADCRRRLQQSATPFTVLNMQAFIFSSLFVRSLFCPELLSTILTKLFFHGKKSQASPALSTEKPKTVYSTSLKTSYEKWVYNVREHGSNPVI